MAFPSQGVRRPVVLSPCRNASCGDKVLGLTGNPHPKSKKHTSTMLLPAPVALHSPCITAGTSKNNPCRLLYLSGGRMLVPTTSCSPPLCPAPTSSSAPRSMQPVNCTPAAPNLPSSGARWWGGMLLCSCPSQGGWGAVPAGFLAHSYSSPASLCQGCPLLRLAGLSGLSLISSCSTEKNK